ncbi:MAG TPA: two-component regulator propeller domain-containing protein [Verrucomicrobiae bacterium]|jgi:ligand-binding sensor domain-containing protein/signal transduction histidine kinase
MKATPFHRWLFLAGLIGGICFSAGRSHAATNEFNPAEQLVIRSWNTEMGLPQNSVNAIVQTLDGYLWLGTQEGLARFDGVRFTSFGLQNGLPSVEINALSEDHAGALWIGTGGGLSRLADGKFENVPLPQRLAASDVVTVLMDDTDHRLWVGTRTGVAIYEQGKFINNQPLASLGHSIVYSLAQSHDGGVWIGTANGLFQFSNNQLTEISGPPGVGQIRAHCLLVDQMNRLWVSIGNGIVLRRDHKEWTTYTETNGLPFDYVTCMAQDTDGTIWAGSLDVGLYRFNGEQFVKIGKENGLSTDDIRSLRFDREGNLWVGTRIGGLNRLSRSKLTVYGVDQGLVNDFTRSVAESEDGTLWVGTIGGGLYRGRNGQFTRMPNELPEPNSTVGFYFAFINSVLATAGDTVWYGGTRGLLRMKNGKLTNCYTNDLFYSTAITALCDDQQGKIWIGTADGKLVHYQDDKFIEFPQHIARGPITALARETNGTLWVGSAANGLKRIQNGSLSAVTNGLLSQSIRTLFLDADGTLWIGTAGGGLSRYQNGHMTTFTTQQGLLADTISQIIPDDNDQLWLGCNHGIFRVAKTALNNLAIGRTAFVHPRVYGISDGMPAEECSGGFCPAGLKTRAGLLCFSTVKGLVLLDPQTHVKTLPRDALLEEVLVNGKVQPLEASAKNSSPELPARVVIPHGAWEVEFHYTAIGLSSPESIRFRYRLDGLDKDWIEADSRRTAYYHDIRPGSYRFQVAACNADGVWSGQPNSLNITVEPYFWETWWFQAIIALGILGLIAAIVRSAERRRYARLAMQHAIEKERLRISKDIHDDIGGILTQVSQLSDLGQSRTESESVLRKHFDRIGLQARAAVQGLDEIVWATNPQNDNLSRFAEYVSRFADEYFENSSVRCWQEVPTKLPGLPLRSNIRHNVFLAIKEAFNNVLKHSGATEVWLRIALNDHQVTIEIEDNGHGFAGGTVDPTGNGLGNMQTRLEECKGRMELVSPADQGTKIRFIFPLSKTD